MDALYTVGTRQLAAIQRDLEAWESQPLLGSTSLGGSSAQQQGQLLSSLTAFKRVVDDYEAMVRRDTSSQNGGGGGGEGSSTTARSEKAKSRALRFKQEHASLLKRFEERRSREEKAKREGLGLGLEAGGGGAGEASSSSASTSRTQPNGAGQARSRIRPTQGFDATGEGMDRQFSESPFGGGGGGMDDRSLFAPNASNSTYSARSSHALREHSFLSSTEQSIDSFLDVGRAALEDLVDQRKLLRKTRGKLVGAAETLGLSRDVIGWVERRR